jgi:hypothetical protein
VLAASCKPGRAAVPVVARSPAAARTWSSQWRTDLQIRYGVAQSTMGFLILAGRPLAGVH